jgi:hypothetical protein
MFGYFKIERSGLKIFIILLFILLVTGLIFLRHTKNTTKIEEKIFGYSVTGRPINGYEIGGGEETFLLMGAIHGDEIGTADLLNSLVDKIKSDPSIVSSRKKFIIIPISNPDGYYDRTDKLNADGVNLNLNFATSDWQTYGPEGTFAGNAPFSEPESVTIKQVVEQYHPSLMISYHSQSALVSPESSPTSEAWAHWYADKTGYKYFTDWDFPGTATKWFLETTGKSAITVELTWDLQNDWERNQSTLLELISSDEDSTKI